MSKLGKAWANCALFWGQASILIGFLNTVMIAGVFYSNVASHWLPLWGFIVLFGILSVTAGVFIAKIGMPAYFKLSRQMLHTDKE